MFHAMEYSSPKRKRLAKWKRSDWDFDEQAKKYQNTTDFQNRYLTNKDTWEEDSGLSEWSPPTSGRSSPWPTSSASATLVVALDCEMVGTGPAGSCSELARCSILDYHGNVLYDRYVQPCHPVTDYRTRWSGIWPHHLLNATTYVQARNEILTILKGKVVVGHSISNDFRALRIPHPHHMVRDIGATHLLRRLAGFPLHRRVSLKTLAGKLLNRHIQVGQMGHCSVEDALAALDLYKLVEGEWEWELQSPLMVDKRPDTFQLISRVFIVLGLLYLFCCCLYVSPVQRRR
ncbi:apoptosis-enhancing nuclease-like [Corythoichthys intestinalis]|uniref:apoptosis-enhancing nuclease-like n=1 Tax=Corythoichthys intestinalis TaxID=161448 RepID=UPI0025A5793B|nr:apoptosis-enhancing nuclease-like [Corythoichthys intestinalis]XP_057691603.1 apoptosis-enhancing nuclease-like [Corythoichthys intestinalis]